MNHLSALIAQEETASGSAAFQFVLLAAVPLALYFLMIRPQRRKMREAAEMQASLAVGDEVITAPEFTALLLRSKMTCSGSKSMKMCNFVW